MIHWAIARKADGRIFNLQSSRRSLTKPEQDAQIRYVARHDLGAEQSYIYIELDEAIHGAREAYILEDGTVNVVAVGTIPTTKDIARAERRARLQAIQTAGQIIDTHATLMDILDEVLDAG